MREIKFRAWDLKNIHSVRNLSIHNNGEIGWNWLSTDDKDTSSGDIVVEQFTGIRDKNGVEIYENDILEYFDVTGDEYLLSKSKVKGVVKWHKLKCKLAPQEVRKNHKGGNYISYWDQCKDIEIVGNIHQDFNLLSDTK